MTEAAKSKRGAVLQFEIDRERWHATEDHFSVDQYSGESPGGRLFGMVKTAAIDTIRNGGTFVLVVTDEKITMIQRPDAEDI
jgi:hypothetical protein